MHKVRDDEEIRDIALHFDDLEFDLQAVDDRLNGLLLVRLIGIEGGQPFGLINASDNEFFSLRLRVNRVATKQTFREQMSQVAVAREMFRRIENRIKTRVAPFGKRNFKITFFSYLQRV